MFFTPKVAAGENNHLRKKNYTSKCSLGRDMAILRFIITFMVPVARKSLSHKISAHSRARVMKPFANVCARSKLCTRMGLEP